MSRERALDKARKVARLARDQADTPEGATAAALLAVLVERWGFTDDDLRDPTDEEVIHVVLVDLATPRVLARVHLLTVIGHIADCLVTYRDEPRVGKVFSPELDRAQRVVEVFRDVEAWLHRRMDRQREIARGNLSAKMFASWDRARQEERAVHDRVRDWWETACRVILRRAAAAAAAAASSGVEGTSRKAPEERFWSTVPAAAAAAAGAAAPAPVGALVVPTVEALTAYRAQSAREKITASAKPAPIEVERWSWVDEAEEALRDYHVPTTATFRGGGK